MMITTINSYEDLVKERKRLKFNIALHKESIKEDIHILKDKFEPLLYILPILSLFKTNNSKIPLVTNVASLGVEFLAQRFLGRAGWITKLAVPVVFKKLASKLLNKLPIPGT